MNSDLTPKQQASEAVRQAEAILIVTGQRPNIDQVASTVALAMILRKLGKKVTAVISDSIPASASFIAEGQLEKNLSGLRDFIVKVDVTKSEVDKLKYTIEDGKLNVHITPFKGGFTAQDVSFEYGAYHYDLIIAMGVPARDKLDRIFTQYPGLIETPALNLDYHRINQSWGAVNLIDTNAATLSEMLVSLAESLQNGLIDEPIATAMLTGIIASTDRFSAPHTTAKAMTVAAQMMAAGAKQPQIIKALYGQRDDRGQRQEKRPEAPRQPERKPDAPKPQVAQPQPTHVLTPAPVVTSTPSPEPTSEPAAMATVPEPVAPGDPSTGGISVFPEPHHDVVPGPVQQPAPDPAPEVPTAPAHNPLETPVLEPETEAQPADGKMSEGKTADVPNEGETSAPSTVTLNPYQA